MKIQFFGLSRVGWVGRGVRGHARAKGSPCTRIYYLWPCVLILNDARECGSPRGLGGDGRGGALSPQLRTAWACSSPSFVCNVLSTHTLLNHLWVSILLAKVVGVPPDEPPAVFFCVGHSISTSSPPFGPSHSHVCVSWRESLIIVFYHPPSSWRPFETQT